MGKIERLEVEVSSEEADAIRTRVENGRYTSTSAVFSAALRALDADEAEHFRRFEDIKARIAAAADDPRPDVPLAEAMRRLRDHVAKRDS